MAMSEARRQLLTIGAFFIVLVVAIVLYAAGAISWTLIVPVVLVLFGLWILALSVMRGANPQKYERSSFSTLSMGLLCVVVGGAWSLLVIGLNWLYALALILLVLAALAIAAALRRK
jgi:hypothetical protein